MAVIGSLIFVGTQVRSNTKTLRASSTYDGIRSWNAINEQLAGDADLGEFIRGLAVLATLVCLAT